MGIGEFFDYLNRESMTPRDAQLIRAFKELDAVAQREVEEFVAFKKSLRSNPLGPREYKGNP
jgi:hypothetical protein